MPSIQQLQRLLAADPADTFVLYAMAIELAKVGKHEEALAFFDRCIAADKLYCYAYFHKGRSLEALGRRDDLQTTLTAGVQAAREAGDGKALSEISGYLASL
jgi:tetratricopeptide (TPR) repeat protein